MLAESGHVGYSKNRHWRCPMMVSNFLGLVMRLIVSAERMKYPLMGVWRRLHRRLLILQLRMLEGEAVRCLRTLRFLRHFIRHNGEKNLRVFKAECAIAHETYKMRNLAELRNEFEKVTKVMRSPSPKSWKRIPAEDIKSPKRW